MKKILLLAISAIAIVLLATSAKKEPKTYTVWQLPSQVNTIGNSYVIQTVNGKVIVMDGGTGHETNYLRGFISALGAEVEAWFVSHPHDDHIQALTEIIKDPKDIKIKAIYHSRFTEDLMKTENDAEYKIIKNFYAQLDGLKETKVVDCHCGDMLEIDGVNFKILSEKNPEMLTNINDQSMVIKVWDKKKSFVFLGDLGVNGGRKLMESKYMEDVKCDYIQMAHHGQAGCDKEFYFKAEFRACLWPTPSWVYNNDVGKGFNTHILKTIEVRDWMKEKGITEHYISYEGLVKIK
jgi:beta-lactamase superfamily II metal-dependent hydrolase